MILALLTGVDETGPTPWRDRPHTVPLALTTEERILSFQSRTNRPARRRRIGPCRPDRAGSCGRVAAGGAWQTNDAANRRESAATDLPRSAQRRGLAKSVWQAVTRSVRTSAGPGTGRVLFPWGHRGKNEPSPATPRGQAACVRRGGALG